MVIGPPIITYPPASGDMPPEAGASELPEPIFSEKQQRSLNASGSPGHDYLSQPAYRDGLRTYWRLLLALAMRGTISPDARDVMALTMGHCGISRTTTRNDLLCAREAIASRLLAAGLTSARQRLWAEQRRVRRLRAGGIVSDPHEVIIGNIVRFQNAVEAASVATHSYGTFAGGLRHLFCVEDVLCELEKETEQTT